VSKATFMACVPKLEMVSTASSRGQRLLQGPQGWERFYGNIEVFTLAVEILAWGKELISNHREISGLSSVSTEG